MPEKASIDRCENCRYWDKHNPTPNQGRRTLEGVCTIMSYPDRFSNMIAYTLGSQVITRPDFHCTLYKVRK